MHNVSTRSRTRRAAGLAVAAVLAIFGVAAVVQGIAGHSTVRDALALEDVGGEEKMTPAAIAARAEAAGLRDVELPTCSVAGKPVDDGSSARCFAQYMRIDALIATGGKTYAQMPRFATDDGRGTDNALLAQKMPNGKPMNNPARHVWITETALTTTLNTSYMAEQISLFGIAVGGSFLLVALAFGAVALSGVRLPRPALAGIRRRAQPEGSAA